MPNESPVLSGPVAAVVTSQQPPDRTTRLCIPKIVLCFFALFSCAGYICVQPKQTRPLHPSDSEFVTEIDQTEPAYTLVHTKYEYTLNRGRSQEHFILNSKPTHVSVTQNRFPPNNRAKTKSPSCAAKWVGGPDALQTLISESARIEQKTISSDIGLVYEPVPHHSAILRREGKTNRPDGSIAGGIAYKIQLSLNTRIAKMRLYPIRFSNIQKMLDFYSQFNPSPLSIKQFIDFGLNACEKKSFVFLRKELPVRLANIMKEIALLPDSLLRMPSVGLVSNWYEQSFQEVIKYEKLEATPTTVEQFCMDIAHIRERHKDVVQTMAQGVIELKESREVDPSMELSIQYFLDRFYMSRISIRMLINQHTILFGDIPQHGRHVGCIDPVCDLSSVVKDAYENARFLCEQYYLACPELKLVQHNDLTPGEPVRIMYVPSHLYHIVFEIFKNSMRAVMEHHGQDVLTVPPIEVTIVQGREDICVKISDRGGGIPRSMADQLFKYMYSTAPQPPASSDIHTVPLAGYGYGLPISRLYARYLHGDFVLFSCEGYGTDAVVYLKAFSEEANELLPIFNKTSSRFYRATVPTGDWSNQTSSMNVRQMNAQLPKRCPNGSDHKEAFARTP